MQSLTLKRALILCRINRKANALKTSNRIVYKKCFFDIACNSEEIVGKKTVLANLSTNQVRFVTYEKIAIGWI